MREFLVSEKTLFEQILGVPEIKYCPGLPAGWLIPRLYPMATDFFSYTKNGLVVVIPYSIINMYTERIFCVDTYCVGQLTNVGKISEAYKWEERMAGHGIKSELIKKIKDFLERENAETSLTN